MLWDHDDIGLLKMKDKNPMVKFLQEAIDLRHEVDYKLCMPIFKNENGPKNSLLDFYCALLTAFCIWE
ncbi:unnamed protein product [Blepharisma stoltei]|uniref:Uncharacterized protein n=1 Tax=Blepharisma stoltei TaxID=1481888 RepID=A0AAU9JKK0_9CILI|nr:unnamed protein product [Blepharisma stoltei]